MQKTITEATSITSHIEAIFNHIPGTSWTHGDMIKKNVMVGQKNYTLMVSKTDPSVLTICEKKERTVVIEPLIYLKDSGRCIQLKYPPNAVHTSQFNQHLMIWEITWRKINALLPDTQQASLLVPIFGGKVGVLF